MKNNTQQIESTNVISFIPDNQPNKGLSMFNAISSLPDLSTAIEEPLDLFCTYWTPTTIGEFKRGIVISVENSVYEKIDDKTGEISDLILPCVILGIQNPDLTYSRVSNGSKKLVSIIEQSLNNGTILAGITPISVKYMGKVKNSTNSYSCDSFSVKILMLNN